MRLLLFFLLFSSLYGTITEPFTLELGTGYREDRLKMRIHLPGNPSSVIYEENYNHLRFVQSEITMRMVQRDIFMYANGGYGAVGSGGMGQEHIVLPFTPEMPGFDFNTSGFAGNFIGILGYMANLTPGRHYLVTLTPFFGYAYYYEKIERKDPSPNPFEGFTNTGSPFTMTSSLSKDLVARWRGFFIGGNFEAKPFRPLTLRALYAYHFLGFQQTVTSFFDITTYTSPGDISSHYTESNKADIDTSDNHGHLGILELTYQFAPFFSLSFQGKIWYFSTHVRDILNELTTTTLFPAYGVTEEEQNRKFKFRQTSLNFLLFFDFLF